MNQTKQELTEGIQDLFGYTNLGKPRIRRYHAELFLRKILNDELIIAPSEFGSLKIIDVYLKKVVNFSGGLLEFINEEALEIRITEKFKKTVNELQTKHQNKAGLDSDETKLEAKGIQLTDDGLTFNKNLTYSKFYQLLSDDEERLNNPNSWTFSEEGMPCFQTLDFSNKDSPLFKSLLVVVKFQVIRKIDEVAFVTSKLVMCPVCSSQYAESVLKIDYVKSYKCKSINPVTGKPCGTSLSKFQTRNSIPTYIYEIMVETKENSKGSEFKEFFLESFVPLENGFHTGMVFCRTETKTNTYYFVCLKAKEQDSPHKFEIIHYERNNHVFFDIVDSVAEYIRSVGFILHDDQARLPFYIETIKKLNVICNREINMDHSLYFGAPGIGKSYSLTLLHYSYFANSGIISGPRFSIAGLTGGQKDVVYQDTVRKKNVSGMFSRQAFVFDEINNQRFLDSGEAVNLFKSVALESSGTAATVGGKEFPRMALVAASGNYDADHLRHYENTVKKIYSNMVSKIDQNENPEQSMFSYKIQEFPEIFDYFDDMKNYGMEVNGKMRMALIKARANQTHYMTKFPIALLERFYWTVLVHPKYDKTFTGVRAVDSGKFLQAGKSVYTNRELLNQLYINSMGEQINKRIVETKSRLTPELEKQWADDANEFLAQLSVRYNDFFSMFIRLAKVHVFTLFSLSMVNGETKLSSETKMIFEKIISLLHKPIDLDDFHKPDFENYTYIGERKPEVMDFIKSNPRADIRAKFDIRRIKKLLETLTNMGYIKSDIEYCYYINPDKPVDEIEKYREELKNEDSDKRAI